MDGTEIDGWRETLRLAKEEHKDKSALKAFTSSEDLRRSLEHIQEAEKMVANFIFDGDGTIDIRGWRDAHDAIRTAWDSDKSVRVEQLLPTFRSTQGKRQRLESEGFLMFRPFFRRYEETIFDPTNETGKKGIFGLNGPQGFGKSVFLHCLALKRAFSDNLVVWVASCPHSLKAFKLSLATAFYRGCQARGLNEIPYMKYSVGVFDLLTQMKAFAEKNGLLLLIIIDQMHRKLEYFEDLRKALSDLHGTFGAQGHCVIMSSSTSGTAKPVFGETCANLEVYDHFLSGDELVLLKEEHFKDPTNHALVQGEGWSFLHATTVLGGPEFSLITRAQEFITKLEQQLLTDSDKSVATMTEYLRVLHMVVNGEESSVPLYFNTSLVDGDLFFVKNQDGKYVIREFMQGFASQVLHYMKLQPSYPQYLESVIGSEHFGAVTRGAQGSILEDAISILLQQKSHPIKFSLTDLKGRTGNKIHSFELNEHRFVHSFSVVPSVDELRNWNVDDDWFVGIPPAGFTGIDFVLARTRKVGGQKVLEIFFIQVTVSTPQDHGVKKSTEQDELQTLLRKKANLTKTRVKLYVTFLTPRLGTGNMVDGIHYSETEVFHSSFQKLEGGHGLARTVRETCRKLWTSE